MATATMEVSPLDAVARLAGKHLTFALGHETYGIPVLKVREIIRRGDITPLPQMPSYLKGILNLRGKIIPVVDLRLRFEMSPAECADAGCIIVVHVDAAAGAPILMGAMVDAVEEVLNLVPSDLQPTPDFGVAPGADYLLGVATVKGSVKMLLDIDRVLVGTVPPSLSGVAGF